LVAVVAAAGAIAYFYRRRLQATAVSVGLPFGLGSTTYDTRPLDRIVAWKLYVQLVTRKAALPFNSDRDRVDEVLNSLFELFGVARELLLELRPADIAASSGVAELIIRVLNDGLRPYLTRWQSDFRHWWRLASAAPEYSDLTPVELQKRYPSFSELVADLQKMNTELLKFAEQLLEIANPPGRGVRRREPIVPLAPSGAPLGAEPAAPVDE
jgi:hypothetical protein